MKIHNIIAATAVAIVLGNTVSAGGLAPQVMETPKVSNDALAPAPTSSIAPAYVILGVLAALLLANAVGGDDDDDDVSSGGGAAPVLDVK